jgi:hypothetical protein
MQLLEEGLTYDAIAQSCDRSESTIRTQLQSAYRKIGAKRAPEAVVKMREADWYPEPPPVIEPEEGPLSYGLKLYLQAFDRHLYSHRHGPETEERTRKEMSFFLLAAAIDRRADTPVPLGWKTPASIVVCHGRQ